MDQSTLSELKKKLLAEKALLEAELSSFAKKDPESRTDWETPTPDVGQGEESVPPDDLADKFEEYENLVSREQPLETRLNEVTRALSRIEEGGYGTCRVCKKPIPQERLEANPAAMTDMEHAE
ncbi:MAG: hypothetical protein A3I44_00775 [Candidatus Sungbacteria bacterium RIFCSPLOWO2_02_FULL_51_17]|uniref:Zinc finger DksA/TraR C4-type domain-containing protein n=1 Tax=Candidatus Sungbacteria bacterium RIFCSPHIGHO2_02_FULL_51_29 TaxID=1802273 RepID=A0A1G2KT49_9BACT|nr:MAG: hypothetical protein A2676_01820 [Candidatus Sungbacteria bacterium RIFCSPHIGHO2_01_FULL_51_22]OHA02513.1 MAG: hypothetical protein A3C16_01305 [Candidatus Sungbacteria bacterium RIFCSPHIGHO2_02_FULL_51_29]OHA07611.1 MAG: hypothetical protein A3B29_03950 [Candidatus Sungbacteria bacterium RIFCSPLOWO2_01_FULL_51_34]OHA10690.1 MAG: hypothetical protein A3I44_00775 [Candidatus Sungbacteria bacterium RIFCSPLOWO2_02_FULL_51_17]